MALSKLVLFRSSFCNFLYPKQKKAWYWFPLQNSYYIDVNPAQWKNGRTRNDKPNTMTNDGYVPDMAIRTYYSVSSSL